MRPALGVPWFADLSAMIAAGAPDGAVLATPNQLHVDNGLECVEAGIPGTGREADRSRCRGRPPAGRAGGGTGVPLLVGHHRRHNPLIAEARRRLEAGGGRPDRLRPGMFWLYKPDDYFEAEWRRQEGAGPVFLNLIHDIDLLRHLVGEVGPSRRWNRARSGAIRSRRRRPSCSRFANGALGTVNVSDTIVAPWSWELTAKENPAYPATERGLLHDRRHPWRARTAEPQAVEPPGQAQLVGPIDATAIAVRREDPLVRQIGHFVDVIRGEAEPLVSGREGLKTLEVVEAVKRSAPTGGPCN